MIFIKRSSALYLRSLQSEQLLKQTRLDKYWMQNYKVKISATSALPFFDPLAHRALEILKAIERYKQNLLTI
jgi:hypothetical protein